MKTCIELGLQPCRYHQLGWINTCVIHQFHWQIAQKKLSLYEIIKYGIQYRRSKDEDHLDCLLATVKEYFPELTYKIDSLMVLL